MATDREYFELLVRNVEKSNADTVGFLKETITEIKRVQDTTCQRVGELEKTQSKNSGIFGLLGHIINFIGLAILGWFQVNK